MGIDWKKGIKDGKYGPMGEDLFAQVCMDKHGVKKVENFEISTDGACPGDRPKDQQKNKKWIPPCAGTVTPSIHPFKIPLTGRSATMRRTDARRMATNWLKFPLLRLVFFYINLLIFNFVVRVCPTFYCSCATEVVFEKACKGPRRMDQGIHEIIKVLKESHFRI